MFRDDEGGAVALMRDTTSDTGASFLVSVQPDGSLSISGGHWADFGTFGTGADAVVALRRAGV